MYSSMPSNSYDKEQRPRATTSARSHTPETGYSSTALAPNMPPNQRSHSIGDIFGPAMDGPPSPERIRVFSNHIKRNSNTDKHRSELTMSSGSSSRLSAASDRQSWNQSRESLGLSRNPSQRSSSAGTPSHERPDSLQFFGKGIFRKGGKLRRGSSDQGGSTTSLDAVEASNESKEQHFIQSVFTRRRALRGEPSASTQKKLQISGPYNFQHLTHTHKDSLPDLSQTNRLELVSEFSAMQGRRHTEAFLEGIPNGESRYPSYSSETFYHQEDPSVGLNADGAHLRASQPPPLPPIRLTKRSQSQDKNRIPPPRPPRSPLGESSMMPLGQPVQLPPQQVHLPPRTSSRTSARHDRFGSLSGPSMDHPGTSVSFRNPQPFAPSSPSRAQTPHVPLVSPVLESEYEEPSPMSKAPHAITTSDDVAWPLSNSISSLPDVPEEEEHHASSRPSRSRMSVASNHSSLRGSVSVPLLRQFSMKRTTSNASDTLGKFDFSSQRTTHVNVREQSIDGLGGDSWEDDIDYCYEHEAEANCDYAWERPSCDIGYSQEVRGRSLRDQTETVITFNRLSDGFLSPGDVPVLSPASQISSMTAQEALTPNLALPVASNFSLPRRESSAQLLRDSSRAQSPERNFKEAQAFALSPSLLIPDDYHQQMLRYEREELDDDSDDDELLIQGNTLDEPIIKFGKNLKPSNVRSSASTTDSRYSEHSMTSSRHKSTTSTSTAFTRWTGSSMSSWQQGRDSTQHILSKPVSETGPVVIVSPTQATMPMTPMSAPKFDEEISPKHEPNRDREKHGRTQSHAGLLMRTTYDAPPAAEPKPAAKEPPKTRRRARTTSRSHAAPLALFPTVTPLPGGRI
ncbi:hypothetical protein F5Y00DRAFT_20907 [Daldinia vernicosa]|uniref:uncharacterized protein n=1 Tax=Daldinia vernicosa TaxID=114800 RepID=UPI002008410E|nr:uncharacterized protein F5Y00DRAFT_20907 [Daldinia vernicosa]KAI0850886.1 hypothetical protein F5Y00DRAFT_20907 [Daldinia vernicosa]